MSMRIQAVNYGTHTELHSVMHAVDLSETDHYEFAFFETCHDSLVLCLESVLMRLLDDIPDKDREALGVEKDRLVELIELAGRTHSLGL